MLLSRLILQCTLWVRLGGGWEVLRNGGTLGDDFEMGGGGGGGGLIPFHTMCGNLYEFLNF